MFNHNGAGYSLSDIAAVTGANNNGRGNGAFGDDWAWIIILLLCGWGNNGFGFGGGNMGGGSRGGYPIATQEDVRDAVDQQTLISKLDQQTYGLADSTYALNNAITTGFHGVDNAICTLGYQTQAGFTGVNSAIADCCCKTQGAIKDAVTQGVMNTNTLATQIANGFCDVEKTSMQNRFDAQTYNCNTLQAIDKLGDRIIDFITQDRIAALTAENQGLKFAASQQAQNAYLVSALKEPCPIPAYFVPNPNCCYPTPTASFGCGCGCN